MKRKGKPLLSILLIALLVVCSKDDTALAWTEGAGTNAGAGKEYTLSIGLIPEQNIFKQMERYEPLATYIGKKAGIKVRLVTLPHYGNSIDHLASGRIDAAFLGSFVYALARAKLGVEVLARPEYVNGVSSYHGLLLVRKDSHIKSAKDMAGKRFAFVDRATTASYLLALTYFKKHGIADYRTYLREFYYAGTHEDVIYDVLNKKADIGAAKNTVYERLARADSRIANELMVVGKSASVPENGLTVRKGLDKSVKDKLKEVLLTMHYDPQGREVLKKFGAQRFIETTDADYRPVYKYARELGLNLQKCPYHNQL
ncbi:MAG: phosphate/phosphite/phosphonate ABC transporter substrate-binding protein [Nitrospirota bacterium]